MSEKMIMHNENTNFSPKTAPSNPFSSPVSAINQIPLLFLDVNLGNDRM